MADPLVLASSDSVGVEGCMYSVTKFRDSVRKQWALTVHTPCVLDIAAYFRSEEHARQFAQTWGLNMTEARRG